MSHPLHQASSEAGSPAPTLAPSAVSLTDVEKKEQAAQESRERSASQSDRSTQSNSEGTAAAAVAAQPAPAMGGVVENEKAGDLAKHITATSQHGNSLRTVQTREDGTEYPTGAKLGLISLALCLAVFLMALDNSIIATAIPKITDEFHSLPDVGWYGSAYLLTTAALQLLFGKMYTYMSIKWVYLTAIGIFELGSLICGVAPNSTALIVGRAIAGLGSAGLMSGSLLILAHSVPLAKRAIYTGLIGGMYGIACVAGPLLGGVFTDHATWRWCFYINLPIGAITVAVIILFFPDPKQAKPKDESWMERINHFDPIGTGVFMPAVICLLLALQWGGTKYAWNDARIIVLFVLFGLLSLAFLYIQYRQQEDATVPPRIMKNRTIWSSGIFAFALGSSFFLMVYYIPLWFQAVQGATAVESGIRNLPMLIATVVLSIVAGGLVTALGQYAPFMIISSVLMSVGAGLISLFKPDTGSPTWIGYQVLYGAGVGLGMQQPLMAVQTVLDIKDVPAGTSVIVFFQTLGGALFVSVAQSLFTNQLVDSLAALVPGLDPAIVLVTGATDLQRTLPAELLPGVILAYNTALTKAFLVAAGLAAVTIVGSALIEWKSMKGKKVEAGLA